MKTKLFALISCTLLLLAAGCNPNPPQPENPLKGELSAPNWQAPTDYDFGSSMTAVVKVDLTLSFPGQTEDWTLTPDDELAAFMDDKCCGVGDLQEGLFWLYITEPDTPASSAVSLRYYSKHYSNIFEAKDVFVFVNDSHEGSVAAPVTPFFAAPETKN